MNNNLLQIKIKERLNKLASLDYDNIECWQIVEAFNKAQLEFVRNQVHGNNQRREGDGATTMIIDDLQNLLVDKRLSSVVKEIYNETESVPADYLYFKKISIHANTTACTAQRLISVYLAEASDTDELLYDTMRNPSFEWAETYGVLFGNKLRVYHDKKFSIQKTLLTYYRKPTPVSFEGCVDIATGTATTNVECEFKDDVAELIIDSAVAILAGDLEQMIQYQRATQQKTINN